MNVGTLVAEIAADANKDRTAESDRIKRAICASIWSHRHLRLHIAEGRGALTLISGTASYALGTGASALPLTLLSISGKELDLDLAGSADSRWPVTWISHEGMDELRRDGAGETGQPESWTFYGRKLELYPTPNSSTDILRFRYLFDIGTPLQRFSTGAWKFYVPGTVTFTGSNELPDTYPDPAVPQVNAWFDPLLGYQVIRHHVLMTLWRGAWQGTGTLGMADRELVLYTEALATIEDVSGRQSVPREIEPWEGI